MLVQPEASASSSVSGLSQSHSQQDNENGTSMGSSLRSVIIWQTPLRLRIRKEQRRGAGDRSCSPRKHRSVTLRILAATAVAVLSRRQLIQTRVHLVGEFGQQQQVVASERIGVAPFVIAVLVEAVGQEDYNKAAFSFFFSHTPFSAPLRPFVFPYVIWFP